MSGRNLGLLGELALSTWCAQVGIVANKSEQDLTGWDYILEFPITSGSEKVSLIDKEPFPLRCFIQVKSTDDNPGKWDVKLDNWLRLVKNPLPCFFLVLEFENQTECQRAYLVHVDKKYITQVLKRLRKASALKTKELHEMTMRFNYSPLDLVSSLNGHGLSEAIHKHVSISPEEYAAQKQQVISTVGYEEGNWTINVDFLPPPNSTDPREVLVDFLLGKVTHLETIKMKITDCDLG
ncbi:MAG: hypothetical protein HC828_22120 [Blastochloris sp.]|nr:hypothetical protein [Blastochloris sp.]